jgi:hypothetical protein
LETKLISRTTTTAIERTRRVREVCRC